MLTMGWVDMAPWLPATEGEGKQQQQQQQQDVGSIGWVLMQRCDIVSRGNTLASLFKCCTEKF
jgi:hypothetical protein